MQCGPLLFGSGIQYFLFSLSPIPIKQRIQHLNVHFQAECQKVASCCSVASAALETLGCPVHL